MGDEEKKVDTLKLKIRSADGGSTDFQVKSTTKMGKIFQAYAAKQSLALDSLRFLTPEGDRVPPGKYDTITPAELNLQDGDSLDCMVQQVGGGDCGCEGRW